MKTWMKWATAAAVVVVLGVVGGPFVYINFIKDDPPEEATLDTVAGTVAGDPVGADGEWTIDPSPSFVGYRVVEVLFGQDTEGVGRTSEITGGLTVAGTQVTAADFEVDMASVTSDEERRDNQFRGRIMDTANFPTATFVLTAPIELGSVPADGVPVTTSATGDLTLKGTTNPVTFDVEAQKNGATIQVVGSTDIVFADYGIEDPSTSGISTQDHGLLEFDLRFVPA